MMTPLDRMRLESGAIHLHACGPRAIAEFLAEIGATIGGTPCIMGKLEQYKRRLSPELLRAVGGDRFPPRPLRVVPR